MGTGTAHIPPGSSPSTGYLIYYLGPRYLDDPTMLRFATHPAEIYRLQSRYTGESWRPPSLDIQGGEGRVLVASTHPYRDICGLEKFSTLDGRRGGRPKGVAAWLGIGSGKSSYPGPKPGAVP